MIKCLLSSIFCLIAAPILFAQTSEIDSLKDAINQIKDDSTKIQALISISESLSDYDIIEGRYYASQALELAQSTKIKGKIGISLLNVGSYARKNNLLDSSFWFINQAKTIFQELSDDYYIQKTSFELGKTHQASGAHDAALEYFNSSVEHYESNEKWQELSEALLSTAHSYMKRGDNLETRKILEKAWKTLKKAEFPENQSLILHLMGEVHLRLGQAPKALEHFLEGLSVAEANSNRLGQLKNLNGLGSLYAVQNNLENAKKYFIEALKTAKLLGDQYEYTGILHNIAYTHLLMNDLDQALKYYQQAIDNNNLKNLKCLLPYSNEGFAMVLEQKGDLKASLSYYNKALDFARDCQMRQNETTILQGLGRVYIKMKDTPTAISHFKKAQKIAEQSNFKNPIKDIAFELFKIYKSVGDYKMALVYHEKYKSLEDSIFNERNVEKITQLADQYDFEREKEQIKAEQQRQDLQYEEEIKREVLYKNFMTFGLIITFILIAALGWSYYGKIGANKKLMQLNEEKNDLISVVAHDLRSPLNNIIGIIPIIKNDSNQLSAGQSKFLELINDSTDRLKDMIGRILDVNAIESQRVNIRKETCDIGEILELIVENFKIEAERKQIQIFSQTEKSKFFALLDRNYFIHIMENLISNAVKFTPATKTITIDVLSQQQLINISVIDQGPGISKEDQKMLFYRYKKLSAKPTAAESSTGLGLSIAKKYVEAMGGKIWFNSRLNEGSTFTVQFQEFIVKSDKPNHDLLTG